MATATVLLLQDSETLLILGEKGQLVAVKATPSGHEELASMQVLDGADMESPRHLRWQVVCAQR